MERQTNSDPPVSRRLTPSIVIAFTIILVGAAIFRGYHLPQQGILGVDEGRYVLDALSKKAEIQFVSGMLAGKFSEWCGGAEFLLSRHVAEWEGALRAQHPFAPKPGFAYASAVVMMLTGDIINGCNYLEAICGVLTVIVLAGFVRDLYGTRAALIASGLLAASVFHIYYSRNAYPQTSAGFVFLSAVWCHLRWYRAITNHPQSIAPLCWLLFCGVLAGVSFWFNYQLAGALPALLVLHAAVLSTRRDLASPKRIIGALALIASGFCAVQLFAEALTYPLILVFRANGLDYPHATYFELLAPRFLGQSGTPWNFSGWPLFPYFLSVMEGPLYVAAFGVMFVGILFCARRRSEPGGIATPSVALGVIYTAIPALVICFLFSFKTMQGARTFVTALPFLFALAALGIASAFEKRDRLPKALAVCSIALLVLNAVVYLPSRMGEVLRIRSAYPNVIDYVRANDPPVASAAWSAVLEAYGAASGVKAGSEFAFQEQQGSQRVFISDWQALYNKRYPDEHGVTAIEGAPIHGLENGFGSVFLTIEAFPSFGNATKNIRWTNQLDLDRARRVLMYATEP
mgnify:CR=1 FL=1